MYFLSRVCGGNLAEIPIYSVTVKVTSLHLAAIAVAAVPDLEVVAIRPPLFRTPDFQFAGVLDANGKHWVVQYPLHAGAGAMIEADGAVVASLAQELAAGHLPFDVIHPAGYAQVKEGRAQVFPEPIGKTKDFVGLTQTDAEELGSAIGAIHSLRTEVLTRVGMPSYSASQWRERLGTELDELTGAAEIPALLEKRWRSVLDESTLWEFKPRVLHGDLAADRFLWSQGKVSCTVGFGDAHVGDPAEDIAAILGALSDDLTDPFLSSYEDIIGGDLDDAFFERASFMGEFALARWMNFGIRTADESIMSDAQTMLRDLSESLTPRAEFEFEVEDTSDVLPASNASFSTKDPL